MADLKDISGWREEYEDFVESDSEERKAFDARNENSIGLISPVSEVLEFAELVLAHEETRIACRAMVDWEKRLSTEFGGFLYYEDPRLEESPREAYSSMADFVEWFCWKKGYALNSSAFLNGGISVAGKVLDGEIASVRHPEAIRSLLDTEAHIIGPDPEADIT